MGSGAFECSVSNNFVVAASSSRGAYEVRHVQVTRNKAGHRECHDRPDGMIRPVHPSVNPTVRQVDIITTERVPH